MPAGCTTGVRALAGGGGRRTRCPALQRELWLPEEPTSDQGAVAAGAAHKTLERHLGELLSWEGGRQLELLYSSDELAGPSAYTLQQMQRKIAGKGPTVTVFQAKDGGRMVGAYLEAPWPLYSYNNFNVSRVRYNSGGKQIT